MPPWGREELEDCVSKCYNWAHKDFSKLYKKWGGSITMVAASESEQVHFEITLEEFMMSRQLLEQVNNLTSSTPTIHRPKSRE